MESLRRAALCLHGLSSSDRRWMLRRVSPAHVPALVEMVNELESMGIPKDPDILTFKNYGKSREAGVATIPGYECISRAHVVNVLSALKGEPLEIVGTLLRADDWVWKDAAMASFQPFERAILKQQAEAEEMLPSQAVRNCLLASLAERMSIDAAIQNDGVTSQGRASGLWMWCKRMSLRILWQR